MTRAIGLILGLGLVAVAVLAGRVAGGHSPAGSAVTVSALPTGELGLSRSGRIVVAPDLQPGGPATAARGSLVVRNQTGRVLAVRMRVVPSQPALDALLMVSLEVAGERPLIRTVGALGRWSGRPLLLARRESRRLVIRAWLPAGLRTGYQGRIVDLELQLRGRPRGVR
jgi:hypothetical protein